VEEQWCFEAARSGLFSVFFNGFSFFWCYYYYLLYNRFPFSRCVYDVSMSIIIKNKCTNFDVLQASSCAVETFWPDAGGWCPTEELCVSAATVSSAFRWPCVAARRAVSWCIDESPPRHNLDSAEPAETSSTLRNVVPRHCKANVPTFCFSNNLRSKKVISRDVPDIRLKNGYISGSGSGQNGT